MRHGRRSLDPRQSVGVASPSSRGLVLGVLVVRPLREERWSSGLKRPERDPSPIRRPDRIAVSSQRQRERLTEGPDAAGTIAMSSVRSRGATAWSRRRSGRRARAAPARDRRPHPCVPVRVPVMSNHANSRARADEAADSTTRGEATKRLRPACVTPTPVMTGIASALNRVRLAHPLRCASSTSSRTDQQVTGNDLAMPGGHREIALLAIVNVAHRPAAVFCQRRCRRSHSRLPVASGNRWARSPGRRVVASVIAVPRSRRITPVDCGAKRIEPSGSHVAPEGDAASATSLTLPSANARRRRCVPAKNNTASPAGLHAGSCAPSVPASALGAIRFERAAPQHRRSGASRDKYDVPFVRRDGGVERLVARAELGVLRCTERQCEGEAAAAAAPRGGAEPPEWRGRGRPGERANDPRRSRHVGFRHRVQRVGPGHAQNFRDQVVGQRSTTTFFSV